MSEAGRAPSPNECVMCGPRCWNDESVRWYGRSWGAREPFCVANGCADQQQRILACHGGGRPDA